MFGLSSLWLKLGAAAALVAALSAGAWYFHHHWWAEGYAQRATLDAAALARSQKVQTVINTRTVTKFRTITRTVYVRGATVIQKVPTYVTLRDNAHCTVNVGFVRLWNDSNRLSVPAPATSADEAASPVVLSDIEAEHAREATLCHANDAQLRALQAWNRATHNSHE